VITWTNLEDRPTTRTGQRLYGPRADCTSASERRADDGGFPRTACIPRISASTPGLSQQIFAAIARGKALKGKRLEPMTVPARVVAELQCRVGMLLSGAGRWLTFLHFKADFVRCARIE